MNRRIFLRNSAIGAAALGISPALFSSCASADPLHEFGIITGFVREMMKADPRGTLEKLSAMGYKYLEFGGTFGMEKSELKSLLKDLDMVPLAGGASIVDFKDDGLMRLIDEQVAMDKKYLICYWPWIGPFEEVTLDYIKTVSEQFNRIGEKCNENGLRFAFHNHDFEFRTLEGRVIYDVFMENTAPELVTMQLDLYWIIIGGADPVEYIKKYPGRYELVHVKDSYDTSVRESFTCVGSGVIDFEPVFNLRDIGGFKHLVVERDFGDTPEEECARNSINYLKSLKF